MIVFAIGSDARQKIHLHVIASDEEQVPWRVGVCFASREEGGMTLHANAVQLGAGNLRLDTVSFLTTTHADPSYHYVRPLKPEGTLSDIGTRLKLFVTEHQDLVGSTFRTSAIADSGTLEIADRTRVSIFVDTYMMGRAELGVDVLRCSADPGVTDPITRRLESM